MSSASHSPRPRAWKRAGTFSLCRGWPGLGGGRGRGKERGGVWRWAYLVGGATGRSYALRPVSRLDSGSAEEDGAAKKQSLYAASAPAMGTVVPAAAARAPTHRRPWRQVLAGEERARDGRQARARGGVPHGEDEPAMAEGPAGKKGMHGAGGRSCLCKGERTPGQKAGVGSGPGAAYPLTDSPKCQVGHPDFTIRRDPKAQEELGTDRMGL